MLAFDQTRPPANLLRIWNKARGIDDDDSVGKDGDGKKGKVGQYSNYENFWAVGEILTGFLGELIVEGLTVGGNTPTPPQYWRDIGGYMHTNRSGASWSSTVLSAGVVGSLSHIQSGVGANPMYLAFVITLLTSQPPLERVCSEEPRPLILVCPLLCGEPCCPSPATQ